MADRPRTIEQSPEVVGSDVPTPNTGSTIGIVCGLKSEAACFRSFRQHGFPFEINVSGADAERAAAAAETVIETGAIALISFGISGALSKDLKPGALLLPREVKGPGGVIYTVNREWLSAVEAKAKQSGLTLYTDPILGVDEFVSTTADKARLAAETGAVAVDMESHAVARVAGENGLPFLAFRAVADPADRPIPSSAAFGVAEDGSTRALPVIAAAAKKPSEFIELIRVGADSAAGLKALRRGLLDLFPSFFRVNAGL